jgi:predicted component of viral defense system (DUF524 family)
VETDSHVAFGDFEVRSRKLDYVTDYQAMLTSIATQSAELLMQRFSPSRITAFTPTGDDTAETLYQRFAFLESMLSNGHFKSAVAMLLHRPHENYENEQEVRLVGRGLKGGSSVGRQFARGGPRTTSAIAVSDDVRRMVPRRLLSDVFEPTFDSEPNRFVKMAFEYWRAICVELMDAMSKSAITSATRRGLLDAQRVVDDLDEVLSHPMFREVGPLTHMPIANQVLQRREGYRDVANLFVLTEAAAQLQWQGGEHVFGAGQRNVAELYEYWCYLQLRRIVETFAKHDVESHDLFEVSKDRVTLGLRRGRAKVFRGSLVRRGRKIGIELWFNKSFSKNESWSKTMRPDCSIRIIADSPLGQTPPDVWLHFDAKY